MSVEKEKKFANIIIYHIVARSTNWLEILIFCIRCITCCTFFPDYQNKIDINIVQFKVYMYGFDTLIYYKMPQRSIAESPAPVNRLCSVAKAYWHDRWNVQKEEREENGIYLEPQEAMQLPWRFGFSPVKPLCTSSSRTIRHHSYCFQPLCGVVCYSSRGKLGHSGP